MEFSIVGPGVVNNRCLNSYLDLADSVFLAEKGRSGSLRNRYPGLFKLQPSVELVVALDDGHVIGGLTLKRFAIEGMELEPQGAMIGFVCVSPQQRGSGVGKQLLEFAIHHLEHSGLDFAVLWTTIHQFYERAGWHLSDQGMLGDCILGGVGHLPPEMDAECWGVVEAVRTNSREVGIKRTQEDYQAIPVCVEKMHCLVADGARDAYVLVGSKESVGVVFEMCGNADRFPQLWRHLSSTFSRLLVNQSKSSESFNWLVANTSINWSIQQQTMWMPLVRSMQSKIMQTYIPYFDRI